MNCKSMRLKLMIEKIAAHQNYFYMASKQVFEWTGFSRSKCKLVNSSSKTSMLSLGDVYRRGVHVWVWFDEEKPVHYRWEFLTG